MKSIAGKFFDNAISIDKPAEFETNISELPTAAGLILFADKLDKPILILASANIRRICKSRLIEQTDNSKRANLKSITTKIYYKTCYPKFRLAVEHYNAIKQIFSSDYKNHIKFILPKFIKIDFSKDIPNFSIITQPENNKNNQKFLGPFPTQKSAAAFLNILEDVFGLCRRNDIVCNTAESKSCPYLQMESCCGVCAGKISKQEYKNITAEAFRAGANPLEAKEKLNQQMQTAATNLQFERAAILKKQIEKISILTQKKFRWTKDLSKLKIIHIDKSTKIKKEGIKKKQQSYAVFMIGFDSIIDIGNFLEDEFEKVAEKISVKLKNSACLPNCDRTGAIEQFSIISYFLYRSNISGLWLDISNGFDKVDFLTKLAETKLIAKK